MVMLAQQMCGINSECLLSPSCVNDSTNINIISQLWDSTRPPSSLLVVSPLYKPSMRPSDSVL